jgi:hypothetical protein
VSVHVDQTCDNLQGVPFPDGLRLTTSESPVRIVGVPPEVPLALVVRAEQFAGGCRVVPALRANRLGLLSQMHAAMNRVADLSRLAG